MQITELKISLAILLRRTEDVLNISEFMLEVRYMGRVPILVGDQFTRKYHGRGLLGASRRLL